jgi:hypothetical protein
VASRTLNRRVLRDRADAAEVEDDDEGATEEGGTEVAAPKLKKARARKAAGTKGPAKPRTRKKTVKVAEVMFARWAVCDNGAKRVATFEYKDRAGADAKLADIQAKKPGTFFLLLVKEPGEPTEPTVPTPA